MITFMNKIYKKESSNHNTPQIGTHFLISAQYNLLHFTPHSALRTKQIIFLYKLISYWFITHLNYIH